MAARCWIGTSGWIYPHWRGVFYPEGLPPSRWFAHYAAHFDTVEINSTFYRLPSEVAFDRWREQAPPGFRYAVKANRYLPHVRRLKDCAEPLARFLDRARRLGDRLGPVLYQLPPNWSADPDRLAAFAALLPPDRLHVFEFRDPRWWVEPIRATLARYSLSFCLFDMPDLTPPLWVTGPIVYIRLHGSTALYAGRYRREELALWAERIRGFLQAGREVYVYFNNDAFGHAVRNAMELREMLAA